MPEDEPAHQPAVVQKHRTPTPLSETHHVHNPNEKGPEKTKPVKLRSSSSVKDPNKYRVSKSEEYAKFYEANGEVNHIRSKTQKERTKHRARDKGGEVAYGEQKNRARNKGGEDAYGEQKPVDFKPVNYDDPKLSYMRNKFGDSFRYN
ncbi:hypothetical protein L1987_40195 [Smallanthus sonchifolius]|uniref:Uncharacterized protein n=1 Tax=Smallanthus sonchifolius TaxID=185202 RepID=A0ACB9GTV4_9ASTR|nr:hypothetical protein L1987_40195 [Smallanthus sonchifolius]